MLLTYAFAADTLNWDAHTVPFHYLHEGMPLIMVPVKLNGKGPFECILDTGNAECAVLISPQTANTLGLDTASGRTSKSYAVNFDASIRRVVVDSAAIGSARLDKPTIGITPAIEQLKSRVGGLQLDGNVGYPFLKEYTVTLDYVNRTLTLARTPIDGRSLPVSINPKKPLIVVEVRANGQRMHFVLDTGASMTCVSTAAAAKLGLAKGIEIPLNMGDGDKGWLTSLPELSVGSSTQSHVRVVAADFVEELGKKLRRRIDGILGFNYWSHFRLSVDYPRGRIALDMPEPHVK